MESAGKFKRNLLLGLDRVLLTSGVGIRVRIRWTGYGLMLGLKWIWATCLMFWVISSNRFRIKDKSE